jgi:serine/threonine-protein kinase
MARMPRLIALAALASSVALCGACGASADVIPDRPGAPASVAVTVQPSSVALAPSGASAFAATVTGTLNPAVTWSVSPAGCGTVTQAGAYTAPATTGTCQVKAVSVADGSRSGVAVVTVSDGATTGVCGAAAGQLFPPGVPWNTPIDAASVDAESAAITGYLATNHTSSSRFQITFDFNILYADSGATRRSFTQTGDFYSPDCDPAPIPVPVGGRLESESAYACTTGGDCHLTVVDRSSCRLYEMWRADISGGQWNGTPFNGGCQAIWNLSSVPPPSMRGEGCTSADAAGLPIVPLVFTADEVAAGHIDHAIRFILPNNLIRHYVYVHPGTHSTGATSGGASAPPYAARLRLKASKDISGLSAGAQVVAKALKKYGMFLADGGNITFTAATDDLTAHKWTEVGVSSSSLKGLSWNDFEVVELGTRYDFTDSCSRTPITN